MIAHRIGSGACVLVVAAIALCAARFAAAQGLNLGGGNDGQPIEINAENGIEWDQNEQTYVARGNASAKRGDGTVYADILTAHYRETDKSQSKQGTGKEKNKNKGDTSAEASGNTEIWRLDMDGNARIENPQGTAFGDKGVYDADKQLLVLTGRDLKLIGKDGTVRARDSLEYWQERNMAVARGAAVATQQDKELRGDTLVAHFAKNDKGETVMSRIDAFGDVRVSRGADVGTGEKGTYNVETGIARLYGSVTLARGKNRLEGEYGEINLNTHVSRLLPGPAGSGRNARVKGVFVPKPKPDANAPAPGIEKDGNNVHQQSR